MKCFLLFLLVGLISCSEHSDENNDKEKLICDYIEIQKKCLTDILSEKSFESITKKYSRDKKAFKQFLKTSDSSEEIIQELIECIEDDDEYQQLKKSADLYSRRKGWDYIPGILPEFKNGNDRLNSRVALLDFSLKDTNAISKIIITDPYSRNIELIRNNKSWTDKNGGCITQGLVHNILDVAKNIEFREYLPKKSHKILKEKMSSYHTKVEFFIKNKWSKTWYIGPSSDDHYGQVMLLSTSGKGKSHEPVIMKIRGVYGIIEPNFFADSRQWICTNIFSVQMEKIQEVEIINHENKVRSFRIEKTNVGYTVSQNDNPLAYVDTANLYRYLHNYKKIHFDGPNYEYTPEQIDSLKNTEPFCELKLKETNGKSTHLKLFRIQSEDSQRNEFGELVNMDVNKLWCELSDGTLVKCQYHVFNPLIMGHIYFPSIE